MSTDIARYSHCSCCDTYEALYDANQGSVRIDWTGTPQQLQVIASELRDPNMPERKAQPDDFDHDHLVKTYEQVIAYFQAKGQ
jgi:hypothetical protein